MLKQKLQLCQHLRGFEYAAGLILMSAVLIRWFSLFNDRYSQSVFPAFWHLGARQYVLNFRVQGSCFRVVGGPEIYGANLAPLPLGTPQQGAQSSVIPKFEYLVPSAATKTGS